LLINVIAQPLPCNRNICVSVTQFITSCLRYVTNDWVLDKDGVSWNLLELKARKLSYFGHRPIVRKKSGSL